MRLDDGVTIESTPEHLVWADDEWTQAREILIGAKLSGADGLPVVVRAIDSTTKQVEVYDLTVAENRNFHISKKRVLVHNISPCEKAAQALVKAVPRSCLVNTKCEEFARAFEGLLLKKGMKGRRLCLHTLYGKGVVFSNRFGHLGTNPLHYGIQVGEMVFDNNWSEGIPKAEWLRDLGGPAYIGAPGSGTEIELFEQDIDTPFSCKG